MDTASFRSTSQSETAESGGESAATVLYFSELSIMTAGQKTPIPPFQTAHIFSCQTGLIVSNCEDRCITQGLSDHRPFP